MSAVYVAGMWGAKAHIKGMMNDVTTRGHRITHDWTSFETELDGAAKLALNAEKDIAGVAQCDVFVAIMDDEHYPYRGSFTELGCALGLKKRVIIVCPSQTASCRTNCFFHHPAIEHVSSWEDALASLCTQ